MCSWYTCAGGSGALRLGAFTRGGGSRVRADSRCFSNCRKSLRGLSTTWVWCCGDTQLRPKLLFTLPRTVGGGATPGSHMQTVLLSLVPSFCPYSARVMLRGGTPSSPYPVSSSCEHRSDGCSILLSPSCAQCRSTFSRASFVARVSFIAVWALPARSHSPTAAMQVGVSLEITQVRGWIADLARGIQDPGTAGPGPRAVKQAAPWR